jgi:GTPase SAR1 family protein
MVGIGFAIILMILFGIPLYVMWGVAKESGFLEPDKKTRKIRQLVSENTELQESNKALTLLVQKQQTELTAYQYQLPWVEVEELNNGPQE